MTHVETLRHLIPDYIDVIALFISNINEVIQFCFINYLETNCSSRANSIQDFLASSWKPLVCQLMECTRHFITELI